MIDLGAGTGRFTVAAAPHVRRVLAVDVSPAMLDALRTRTAAHDNVEAVQAGLLTYEHRGEPADAIHSRNTLHQLPDFWKVIPLHRMARMLRPDGILRLRDLVYDFSPEDAEEAIDAWLDGAATDPAAGYTREDLAQHLRGEHSTFSWLLARCSSTPASRSSTCRAGRRTRPTPASGTEGSRPLDATTQETDPGDRGMRRKV